jgi:nucleoside-diphosphate-sugar epimerase
MTDALIGYSGFVGANLSRTMPGAAGFNSRNIDDIAGCRFDTIVCAGVSAAKWLANKDPEGDRAQIARLERLLASVTCAHFTLISTVDVYREPWGVDEDVAPDPEGLHPYGLNRLQLESFVASRFANHLVIRLPALFGAGLKKNALYDLMFNNNAHLLDARASFQWYDVGRLHEDLSTGREHGVRLLNVTSPPIQLEEIRQRFFASTVLNNGTSTKPAYYDVRSRHAALFGGDQGYLFDKSTVLDAMGRFVTESRP